MTEPCACKSFSSTHELHQHLLCDKEKWGVVECYPARCVKRSCSKCVKALEAMSCPACRAANPNITYEMWDNAKYQCADGRVLDVKDFQSRTVDIDTFMERWRGFNTTFFQHHNRAIFHDYDWKELWSNVSDGVPDLVSESDSEEDSSSETEEEEAEEQANEGGHVRKERARREHSRGEQEEGGQQQERPQRAEVAIVMDFSKSYTSQHREEHMQKFWSQVSTTMLGFPMKIALSNLNDQFFEDYFPPESDHHITRAAAAELLAQHGMKPEVAVMHNGITQNPHHNTATVQYYIIKKLMPWVWKYTVGLEDAVFYFRSDNCGGQFLSGRHFRFISEWSKYDETKDTRCIWSHFEEKHGKDMSDWELGRQKWLLYCQEMRHTKEDPTWMRTSKEVYQWLDSTARHSKRTFQQKQGAGVFLRVYHWAENKEIPPLASLAEIKTLKDTAGNAVTQMGHLWIDVNNPGYIKTREYACLTCPQCIRLKFGKCTLGFARVNTLRTCQIKYENSGLLITERETGNRGRERALACALGDLIGAECADDMEPYIVCRVTGTFSIYGKGLLLPAGWGRSKRMMNISPA